MSKMKKTKMGLLMSVISIVLCCSMLVGTTFAWFTDTASTSVNTIKSGTLDVELQDENGNNLEGSALSFVNAKDKTEILWEPNVTFKTQPFKVVNKGDLALEFVLEISGVKGDAKLLEVIKFWLEDLDGEKIDLGEEVALAPSGETMTIWGNEVEDSTDLYVLVGHMDAEAGNEYQGKTVDTVAVSVYATQVDAEYDSFNNIYDEDSVYPAGSIWDGATDDSWYEEDAGTAEEPVTAYYISTADQLAAFAELVNGGETFAGKTVYLTADIDLNNVAWTPIGPNADAANKFQGTFDGQGNTIYNLYVEQGAAYHAAGLFGSLNGTVKNLIIDGAEITSISAGDPTDNGTAVVAGSLYSSGTIDKVTVKNATVNGNRYVGGISGYTYGNVTNCTVENIELVAVPDNESGSYNNGDKVGGIAGYFVAKSVYSVSGNTAKNVSIRAYRDMGGIIGSANYESTEFVSNNTVDGLVIVVDQVTNHYEDKDSNAGAIVGRYTAAVKEVNDTNTASDVIISEVSENGLIADTTKARTYYVSNAEDLIKFNEYLDTITGNESTITTVVLTSDIDMSDETWKPIEDMFINIDGNGYTISNLNCETSSIGKSGLYAYLGGGSIKNLTLENVTASGEQVGAFAGLSTGTITNCVLKGDIVLTYSDDSSYNEEWGGIGAVAGVVTEKSTFDVTIDEDATVELDINTLTTNSTYDASIYGYVDGSPAGTRTVVNNGRINVSISSTLTPENYSTTTISSNTTYSLKGDFGSQNVSFVMADGVENVVFDGSNATNINELIVIQNGNLIDNANDVVGERSGKVTVQNFKVLSQINVFACKTEVVVQNNTAEALMVHAGNCDVKVLNNTIDANFESHSTYRSATDIWNTNNYGIALNIFDYNLWFEGNTVTDSKSHAVGINGWEGTFNIGEENVIESFKNNTITVNTTSDTKRAAFKVWDDETYASRDDDTNVVNATAQAFMDAVLADGSNIFNITEGSDHTIFCFYNVNTNK